MKIFHFTYTLTILITTPYFSYIDNIPVTLKHIPPPTCPRVEQKQNAGLTSPFSTGRGAEMPRPFDPLYFRGLKKDVSEKLPQG